MLWMQKHLLTKPLSWSATANMKFWICSTRRVQYLELPITIGEQECNLIFVVFISRRFVMRGYWTWKGSSWKLHCAIMTFPKLSSDKLEMSTYLLNIYYFFTPCSDCHAFTMFRTWCEFCLWNLWPNFVYLCIFIHFLSYFSTNTIISTIKKRKSYKVLTFSSVVIGRMLINLYRVGVNSSFESPVNDTHPSVIVSSGTILR